MIAVIASTPARSRRRPSRPPPRLHRPRRRTGARRRRSPPPPPAPAAGTGARSRAPAPAAPAPAQAPAAAAAAPAPAGDGRQQLLSPVVRRLVAEHGLDPAAITGTGAGGRITRDDVLDHIDKHVGDGGVGAGSRAAARRTAAPAAPAAPAAAAPAPAAAAGPRPSRRTAATRPSATRSSRFRRSASCTGDHMVMSLATVAARVQRRRGRLRERRPGAHARTWTRGRRTRASASRTCRSSSRAVIDAIAEFPHLNATVGDGELIVHHYVDLGIAVDLTTRACWCRWSATPTRKRLRAIAREIYDLADSGHAPEAVARRDPAAARSRSRTTARPASVLTAAIINQPQVAILSTDAIKRRPVVVDGDGRRRGASPSTRSATWR